MPKSALHCSGASTRACAVPMVLRKMLLVAHLKPLVAPMVVEHGIRARGS